MLPRLLRSLYRKEPITAMILTAGAVNVVLGGLDGHDSLVLTGLGIVGLALGLRWLQHQKQSHLTPNRQPSKSARYALPDRVDRSVIPDRRSPRRPR